MARPLKQGLDYYPVDVEFYRDIKMRRLTQAFGMESLVLMLTLLGMIYKDEGYFTHWNEDLCFLAAADNYTTEEQVEAIVQKAVAVGYFDQKCYATYGILTSQEIQKHYLAATYKRKQVTMVAEYFLAPEDARPNLHLEALGTSQEKTEATETPEPAAATEPAAVTEVVEAGEMNEISDRNEVAPANETGEMLGATSTSSEKPLCKTKALLEAPTDKTAVCTEVTAKFQHNSQSQLQPKSEIRNADSAPIQEWPQTTAISAPKDTDCPPEESLAAPLAEAELAEVVPATDWHEENPANAPHPAEMQENLGADTLGNSGQNASQNPSQTLVTKAQIAVFPQAPENKISHTESFQNWCALWRTPNLLIQKELARLMNQKGDSVVALAVQIAGEKQVWANHALSFIKSCLGEWEREGLKELTEIQVYQKRRNQRKEGNASGKWKGAGAQKQRMATFTSFSQSQGDFSQSAGTKNLRPGQGLEDWSVHKTPLQDRQTWLRLQKECALLMGEGYVPDENFTATPEELTWIRDAQADYQHPVYLAAAKVDD